jgi:hypothetical protein
MRNISIHAKYHYLQWVAHKAVTLALQHGDLLRPKNCEACGQHHTRITAHHEDYSKPLDVVWLCPSCHHHTHYGLEDITTGKTDMAMQWLKQNPDDLQLTGRALAASVRPQGIEISYVTWNRAKRLVADAA